MGPNKSKTSRQVALEVLNSLDIERHNAKQLLNKKIGETEQGGQATDIVYGSIRNRMAIDMVIAEVGGKAIKQIKPKLLNILRIGVYELVFSPKTAEYAIVNEAVNVATIVTGKKPAGFVNAILRKIERNITNRNVELADADAKRTLPQSQRHGCEFAKPILPEPSSKAVYLSKAFSLPKWLVRDWVKEFGFEEARQVCFGSNHEPGVFIRANTLRISFEGLCERFSDAGIDFATSPDGLTLKLGKGAGAISNLPGFDEGLFNIQDPTAAAAARKLAPKAGEVVVDLCAAPGGKTIQMAQMMGDVGSIIATDIAGERLKKVDENCKRLGITIVKTVAYDNFDTEVSGFLPCDKVLLDVPCSNTGVLSRRVEARLRMKPDSVKELQGIQLSLLKRAASLIKDDGRICYSTCSILRDENSDVVSQFLLDYSDFELQSESLILPRCGDDESFGHDGGYAAVISKKN